MFLIAPVHHKRGGAPSKRPPGADEPGGPSRVIVHPRPPTVIGGVVGGSPIIEPAKSPLTGLAPKPERHLGKLAGRTAEEIDVPATKRADARLEFIGAGA